MIYAIRNIGSRGILVELPNKKALTPDTKYVTPEFARRWVRDGMIHETGLFTDYDGRMRYAQPGP